VKVPGYGHFESLAVNLNEMIGRMKIFKGASILDVGAGSCRATKNFAELGCYAVAMDIDKSNDFLNNGNGFERVQGDMNIMPFRNGTFDYVFFNNALHHTSYIDKTLRQAYSMLKKDGKLVLVGEPSYGLFNMKYKDTFGRKEIEEHGANENIHTFLKYRKEMLKAGFKKFKFFFPPAIDMKLSTGKFGWKNVNEKIFKLLHYIWKISLIKKIIKRFFIIPAALAYNFQIHCIAEKD